MNDLIPKSTIPAGKAGDYAIEKFTITEEAAKRYNISLMFNFDFGRDVEPGDYTRLVYRPGGKLRGGVLMSDTTYETLSHLDAYINAMGDVLINGLGLGLIARAVLLKDEVRTVTINELSKDVISLVFPHLQKEFGDRVKVNNADALEWKPSNGERFNTVWHDIWMNICYDNYEEYKKLMRRYSRWLKKPHWQYCWAYGRLKRIKREEASSVNPWRW